MVTRKYLGGGRPVVRPVVYDLVDNPKGRDYFPPLSSTVPLSAFCVVNINKRLVIAQLP